MNSRIAAIIAIVATITAILSATAGTIGLKFDGGKLIIFCTALTLLGVVIAALVVWRQRVAAVGGVKPDKDARETVLEAVLEEADSKLIPTRAGLDRRAVVFVLGPTGAAKTSTLLACGQHMDTLGGQLTVEAQPVAGQRSNPLSVVLVRDTVFVDVNGELLDDSGAWKKVVARFRSKLRKSTVSVPRAALVCVPCDEILGVDAGKALGRKLRQRLDEASEVLGVRIPIYVLFTRVDCISSFAEYVVEFSDVEAVNQIFGASFPLPRGHSLGSYANEAEKRFADAFEKLFEGLATVRLEQMMRLESPYKCSSAYEFPREFSKLQPACVSILKELDRPSQISLAPFVRGMYFSGVRPVSKTVDAPALVVGRTVEEPLAANATVMLGAVQLKKAPTEHAAIPRTRKAQWMFLPGLFDQILLADIAARTFSGGSVRVDRMRRALLLGAVGVSVGCVAVVGWAYAKNENLLRPTIAAAQTPIESHYGLPSISQLTDLDAVRQDLEKMDVWKTAGVPAAYRFGLYIGEELAPISERIYFSRLEELLRKRVNRANIDRLRALPSKHSGTDDYNTSYNALKAHLVMTSEFQRPPTDWATEWLSEWLFRQWGRLYPDSSNETNQLVRRQFHFYANRLRSDNPYSKNRDSDAVRNSRTHLSDFSKHDQIYDFLLRQASSAAEPIQFSTFFPDATAFVTNSALIDGAWTVKGWTTMIRNIDGAQFGAEEWVVGRTELSVNNPEDLKRKLLRDYSAAYIEQWTRYLHKTSLVSYRSAQDASTKLRVLSQANTSPLLASLWLASQHTAVNEEVRTEFAAVHAIVASHAAGTKNFVTPNSQQYANVLSELAAAVEGYIAATDTSAGMAVLKAKASTARSLVNNLAGSLPRGTTDRVAREVASILEMPILNVNFPDPLGEKMNNAAQGFCKEWNSLAARYPFSPLGADATIADLAAVFARPEGSLARLEAIVRPSLQSQGAGWELRPDAPVKLRTDFVAFINSAARFGREVFGTEGSRDPRLRFSLSWKPSEHISLMTVSLEGQSETFEGSRPDTKTLSWSGTPSSQLGLDYKLKDGFTLRGEYPVGPWSLFRFLDDAKRTLPPPPSTRLIWVLSAGASARPILVGGKELSYQFSVEPNVLTREYRSQMRCVPQATIE